MRILKSLGVVIALVAVIVGLLLVTARFSDGPVGMIAGGPLRSGAFHLGPEPEWDFVNGLDTVEFQLMKPARSRTTWILLHDGRIFIPSGYMNSGIGRLWKQWPPQAERDGRALLRVGGSVLYPRQLSRVRNDNLTLIEPLVAELNRKYGQAATMEMVEAESLWLFELHPR